LSLGRRGVAAWWARLGEAWWARCRRGVAGHLDIFTTTTPREWGRGVLGL
jgi:hypothetical protein